MVPYWLLSVDWVVLLLFRVVIGCHVMISCLIFAQDCDWLFDYFAGIVDTCLP